MESINFWKILRVLTTDWCNYNCYFCHNEGQRHRNYSQLQFKHFRIIVQSLFDTDLKEIQFSGGEPFLNSDTIRMISWVNDFTKYEIGCATNASCLNIEIISRLKDTRTTLNIQLPSVHRASFNQITGTKYFELIMKKIELLLVSQIKFSVNYVLNNQTIDDIKEIIFFCGKREINLKFLPFISSKLDIQNNKFELFNYLDQNSVYHEDLKNGSLKWKMIELLNKISIKYIDFPCFKNDIQICKNYGEIRLLPDSTLQTCLLNHKSISAFNFEICQKNQKYIREIFYDKWRAFTFC